MDLGFILIIGLFLIYYFSLIIFERKLISEPRVIIDQFFAVTLLYAGVSLIYYSITGTPFLNDSVASYNIYIFVIGFVSILWTIPMLMNEFTFFRKFFEKKKKRKRK